jgi:hypothetical protein
MENCRVFSSDTLKRKELLYIKKNVAREDFVSWLKDNYDALRCYHSTRPKDVSRYYKQGLMPTDMLKAAEYFKQVLHDINFTGEYDIQETIDTFTGDSDKHIHFILYRDDFIDTCPHYLIYGSELILCFAQHVSSHIKYTLKEIGIPTIFHCDIPLLQFDDDEIIDLYDRINRAKGTREQMLYRVFSNYSIIVEGNVSPDCIVHHEHPTDTLWDGHSGVYYQNTVSTCPHCAQ